MRRERFRRIWAVITVMAFATITIESAGAHDKGCDGNPVPVRIKLDCCGGEEEHQLKPEQISRGANNEYIVSFEGYRFVIPADKALPSNDPCSHIFFPNMWVNDDDGGQVARSKNAERPLFPHTAGLLTAHLSSARELACA